MTAATHRLAMIALVVAVSGANWGCAVKQSPVRHSTSEDVRAQLTTVGLPVAAFAPETQVDAPTSGKGIGALKGAGYGVAAGATPGMAILEGLGKVAPGCVAGRELGVLLCGAVFALGVGVAAAGGTVGALGGTVYGVVTAESGSKIDAAEAELKSTVVQADIQMMLRDHVLQAVRDRSSLNFMAVDDQRSGAAREDIDYQALANRGIDTALEVSVGRIGLTGESGINPPVSLLMTARARLVRTADGVEMYAETFDYRGGEASKFLEWAADDGQIFRKEIERGMQSLAEDIARLVFPEESACESTAAAAASAPVAAPTAVSSEPPAPRAKLAVPDSDQRTTVDPLRLAVLGTWQGSFRPAEESRTYPATLRIFEDRGELRWELSRRREGRELAGSGVVTVADATVTLTGTSQTSPVTYALRRIGPSLVGTGSGLDDRMETLMLMRMFGP